MKNKLQFLFIDNPSGYAPKDAYVVHLSAPIMDNIELYEKLKSQLNFPDYFGFNWDALYDCLRDLNWIKNQKVIIVHDILPVIDDVSMRLYIEILYNSIKEWNHRKEDKLQVVFPINKKDVIDKFLHK